MRELAKDLAQRPHFAALKDRIVRAADWRAKMRERKLSRACVALLVGISLGRLTGLLSGERMCSDEERERLDAVIHEGRDLGDVAPCAPAPRANFGRRGSKNGGEWAAHFEKSGKNLVQIAIETGIAYFRVRRLRSGAHPSDAERAALEKVIGPAED